MDDFLTPADLSRELGVSQLRIRIWLREEYGVLPPTETRWRLTDAQAAHIRAQARGTRN